MASTQVTSAEAASAAAASGMDEFEGAVDTTTELPSRKLISEIDNFLIFDRYGKSCRFRNIYTGPHIARRVLNCQQYLSSIANSITPADLLNEPLLSTAIVVIGCGDPGLIASYAEESGCPFSIFTDPTGRLYEALGMIRTLGLGDRPAYTSKHLVWSSITSVGQGLKQLRSGLAGKGGDMKQVGGEFLFEPPLGAETTPLQSPVIGVSGEGADQEETDAGGQETGPSSEPRPKADDKSNVDEFDGDDKIVTWCHRMRTTRDHVEVPELMEVLGLKGDGKLTGDKERWERALKERLGTGKPLYGRNRTKLNLSGGVVDADGNYVVKVDNGVVSVNGSVTGSA
ncbi:AhpC/TSA antioxidant enzyme-domain-containing protein [Dichotomopilus funicola]|uniref:AhpC/TSA antioxidant enzyme-domain-containing protein n=1 Tax=Dichotomopilus funicola TaxID=1934379 RepID=A0AAN6VAW8_9PEZI|nr:AhpC/TSA antioxidant enzyme-domain-containing protein [Dichotomopilus funicola]